MKLTHGLAALSLLALGAAAHADVTGTVTVVSDYDFRGITQTAQDPALQGSIDWTSDSGIYLGAWGSNVDFGDDVDVDVEVDLYGGIRGGEDITWDLGIIYYTYMDGSEFNYPEIYASVGYKWLSGKLWYSDEFGGVDDNGEAYYIEANASFPVAETGLGVTGHVGMSDGDYWDSVDGYFDWSVGVTYALGHFNLGLKYIDGSDLEEADGTPDDVFSSEARAVFSVSTTFPWGD
jgi:uncharacterized protein (TIGR02001 family)